MLKVGITLEGNLEELVSVLQYISAKQRGNSTLHNTAPTEQSPAAEETQAWTEEKIRLILSNVSDTCESLLRELVKHEDGITTLALSKTLGLNDERGIGGVLSSLGRQLNNPEYEDLPYPLDWTKYGRRKMIPIWRDIVAELVEE